MSTKICRGVCSPQRFRESGAFLSSPFYGGTDLPTFAGNKHLDKPHMIKGIQVNLEPVLGTFTSIYGSKNQQISAHFLYLNSLQVSEQLVLIHSWVLQNLCWLMLCMETASNRVYLGYYTYQYLDIYRYKIETSRPKSLRKPKNITEQTQEQAIIR